MTRPTKEQINAMTEQVMTDVLHIRNLLTDNKLLLVDANTEAWAGVETFVAIALRVFAETNPSKLKEAMRIEQIKAYMDGREVIG